MEQLWLRNPGYLRAVVRPAATLKPRADLRGLNPMPSPEEDVTVMLYHMHEVAHSRHPDEAEYKRVRQRLMTLPYCPAFLSACPDYGRLRVQYLQVAKHQGSYGERDAWTRAQMAEFRERAPSLAYTATEANVGEAFDERIDHKWGP